MEHQLPKLPYALDALEPYISKETLEYHYGKHHKTYVDKLNAALKETDLTKATLEEIIQKSSGGLFNNAAQVWNHTFYWNCLAPKAGGSPTHLAADIIKKSFGSFDKFKEEFSAAAANNFGSGWTWVVKKNDGTVAIENTSNAGTPIKDKRWPVLTLDVWEHAYYIDYRNARPKYIDVFWNLVNWDFVNKNLG
ncbi:MAG: superoxide dismutase [Deltaproteobacteria bacterium RIFCSPLOWO2_02_FULL_50_16]|nr:MAG: superoxide dismutase [Deltaproteobacteria bacterium GWA2_50_8]OGQ27886.1 MAG: superoxide dismutase [Deltaproteobacteria bacterium RIFCSPHIGHO2_02_FULL_50_15]OGQ56437.1 MAG: superoxide dismutase [Deltaproteobacteria bacterium RIFCSPLOWO2_02_FULL_50_16]OGQ66840.1 MAG: superoxide dismutase [Deltaproteobacteria bacterium RIFCSPLOWO2_12_FULL_50_11]